MPRDTNSEAENQSVRDLTEALAEEFNEGPESIERDAAHFNIENPSDADAQHVVSSEER